MKKSFKTYLKYVLFSVFSLMCTVVLSVGSYAIYLETGYYRIPDNTQITPVGSGIDRPLELKHAYVASTYNVGFGAYTPDYTFFMDEGTMKDGTPTVGVQSRAKSRDSVLNVTKSDINVLKKGITIGDTPAQTPDFMIFQEIDTDSDRSFHVNQVDMVNQAFSGYQSSFANNFHSRYLMYPLFNPHGAVQSGLLTMSKYNSNLVMRRQYYITQQWPTKYFDLDRCFLVNRIPVENGKELVLINSHMSAYDKNGTSRVKQLALLTSVMQAERNKGNYVVVGGDFNHALFGSVDAFPSEQKVPKWVSVLDQKDLPQGFELVRPNNYQTTPTCRGVDIPYKKGVTYTCIVDGFIVSDNVKASGMIIDTEFTNADHNPSLISFELK